MRFLYPQLCSFRARFQRELELRGDGGRDLIFLCFFIGLEVVTYLGTEWVLRTINQNPNLIFLHPAQPLSLFLACLLVMTFLSALVTAYDSYFDAYDMDLLFASPIKPLTLYLGRFLNVILSVSWMPFLLLIPILAAFGQVYQGSIIYYIGSLVYFIPYFLIPSALAVIIATLFARFIPRSYSRNFLILLAILFVIFLYYGFGLLHQLWIAHKSENQLGIIIQVLTKGESLWIPSYWTARAIEGLLIKHATPTHFFALLSFSTAISLTSLGYLLFEIFHCSGYNNSHSKRSLSDSTLTKVLVEMSNVLPFRHGIQRALFRKEALLFSREIAQIIQLMMMASLVALYLINLRAFIGESNDSSEISIWYQRFAFIGNFSVGAFISIAACTRLVFPSLSLEGRAMWILQTAPITLSTVIRSKFFYWFTPVAVLSLTLFGASAFVIKMSPVVALCYGISSLCIAYGVVGSACGLGACYARFDWESPSQLCAGFGSLMYMLYSSFLVTVTMTPTWFLLFKSSPTFLTGAPTNRDMTMLVFNSLLIFVINYSAAWFAIRMGERALERMRAQVMG